MWYALKQQLTCYKWPAADDSNALQPELEQHSRHFATKQMCSWKYPRQHSPPKSEIERAAACCSIGRPKMERKWPNQGRGCVKSRKIHPHRPRARPKITRKSRGEMDSISGRPYLRREKPPNPAALVQFEPPARINSTKP
jgi:hypothetical protein